MQHKQLLSIEEVVIGTGICPTNIYAQMKAGNLKAIKVGRRTLLKQIQILLADEKSALRANYAAEALTNFLFFI